MDPSILRTIKAGLGLKGVNVFDEDLVIFINSALATLKQLGVCDKLFRIGGEDQTWNDMLPKDKQKREEYPCVFDYDNVLPFEMIKEFILLKVRTMFDPPSSSYVLQAMKEEIEELKWRILAEVEEGQFDERKQSV